MDAVTAISGSGPAYIFFVVESMIEAGVHLGLPRATATDLVVQTVVGSATMLRETGTHPVVLREQVTSPGGTTAAALRELEDPQGARRVPRGDRGRPRPVPRPGRGLVAVRSPRGNLPSMVECSGPALSSSTPASPSTTSAPSHPMSPLRVDLTMRLAESLGVVGDRLRAGRRAGRHRGTAPTVHDRTLVEAVTRAGTTGRARRPVRPRHRRQPGLPRHAPRRGPRRRRQHRGVRPGVERRASTAPTSPAVCTTACPTGPAASASTTTSRRHPAAARPGRRAGRLRRRRRPPRRRRREDLLGRPAGAHDLAARDRADAVPRHRLPERRRRARRARGRAVNVALPPGTGDAGWLRAFHAVVPPLLREFKPESSSPSTAATPTSTTRSHT